jgi:hypothetical protein
LEKLENFGLREALLEMQPGLPLPTGASCAPPAAGSGHRLFVVSGEELRLAGARVLCSDEALEVSHG